MNKSSVPYGLILLCCTWILAMMLVVPVDYDWTIILRQNRIAIIDQLMDRTLFEGEALGGGDPVILLVIFVAVAYYFSWKKGVASRFYAWRPHLGFILTAVLICSVMMVHSLKWIMGRARPLYVIKGNLPFSDWFVFGPHFIVDGTYRGSFPSGHVAQVFVLMTIAYLLIGLANRSSAFRLSGWLWGSICLIYTVMMGISRCMTLSHWLSDGMGALGLAWILMHLIYFQWLKVPQQAAYYQKIGKYPQIPTVWELRLCAHVFGLVVGGVAVLLGIRAMLMGETWLFYLLTPPGIVGLILFFRRARFLYLKIWASFASVPTAQ